MLVIDVGNTNIKSAVWNGHRLIDCGSFVTLGADIENDFESAWLTHTSLISKVMVSNVAASQVRDRIKRFCKTYLDITPEFVVPQKTCMGMSTRYQRPDALGVDRWLASLAAWTLSRGSVCVVDVGTALTVDVVVADGEHVGGLIAPGPDMLKASLVSGTAGIEIDQFGAADRFGINTVEAISLGCRSALKGVLREVEQQLDMLGISETTSWYLTGGAGEVVKELIPNKHIDNPRLVLEGLVALGLYVD
jgi:type III pantothenate kinase